ncbi:hypothetical protein NQ315_016048 [Exocentrus adspersus]|uniref:CCHC-type domain-containing protein n=1 Tax=Exocentrus adspersus TaxID=1586481 RepID=A0AAV8VKJ2_9CUCU|nr:hypothetical protein NQ315_016048 [Exocentrus adspersus]
MHDSQNAAPTKYVTNLKVPTLLSLTGGGAYKILRDLSYPNKPNEKTYDALCDILSQQFASQASVWRERLKFYAAQQETGEKLADFYARIKSLSVNCKFGANLDSILKDRLMSGLRSGKILDRLCEEEITKSLNDMVRLGMQKESETHQSTSAEANKVARYRKVPAEYRVKGARNGFKGNGEPARSTGPAAEPTGFNANNQVKRKPCGSCCKNHVGLCKYANFICNRCKKKGHLAQVCRRQLRYHNYLEFQAEDIDDDSEFVHAVRKSNRDSNDFKLSVVIDNIKHTVEADCGASVSCVNEQMYRTYFNKYALKLDSTVLKGYIQSQSFVPKGYFWCNVRLNKKEKSIRFYVIKNGGTEWPVDNSMVREETSKDRELKKVLDAGRSRSFAVGQNIMARDYRKVNVKAWTPAKIIKRIGKSTYLCQIDDTAVIWKRHCNQIISRNTRYQEIRTDRGNGAKITASKIAYDSEISEIPETPEISEIPSEDIDGSTSAVTEIECNRDREKLVPDISTASAIQVETNTDSKNDNSTTGQCRSDASHSSDNDINVCSSPRLTNSISPQTTGRRSKRDTNKETASKQTERQQFGRESIQTE